MEIPKQEEDDARRNAAEGDPADEHLTKMQPDAEPEQSDSSYDEDDEAIIRDRLESLGYL